MGEGASPERPRIGVVVGEGHPVRMGLLRFVLEGEGFLVLAEASSTVELVQALAIHRPEAVVLDDGIGATAVAVTREMCPTAKIVLVWPARLVPISGDACVDPTDVLRDLGPAIERVCGVAPPPEPDTAEVRSLAGRRRGGRKGSHPSRGPGEVVPGPGLARDRPAEGDGEAIVVDREPAPVLILPVTPAVEPDPRP